MLATIFEFTPVALALAAAIVCSTKAQFTRRKQEKIVCALGTLCAVLLIFAQTSWWATYRVYGLGLGTDLANHVWTIFNTLTMTAFLVLGWPRK